MTFIIDKARLALGEEQGPVVTFDQYLRILRGESVPSDGAILTADDGPFHLAGGSLAERVGIDSTSPFEVTDPGISLDQGGLGFELMHPEDQDPKTADRCYIYISLSASPVLIEMQQELLKIFDEEGAAYEAQKPERFHITLMFIERIDNYQLQELIYKVNLPASFDVQGVRMGTFPEADDKPAVLMVDPDNALLRIQQQLYERAVSMGLEVSPFSRPGHYKPHVTLAYDVDPEDFQYPVMDRPVNLRVDSIAFTRPDYRLARVVRLPELPGGAAFVVRQQQPDMFEHMRRQRQSAIARAFGDVRRYIRDLVTGLTERSPDNRDLMPSKPEIILPELPPPFSGDIVSLAVMPMTLEWGQFGNGAFDAMEAYERDGIKPVERGGPGSGHFGHEGRPGEVGGSQPESGGSAGPPSGGQQTGATGEGSATPSTESEARKDFRVALDDLGDVEIGGADRYFDPDIIKQYAQMYRESENDSDREMIHRILKKMYADSLAYFESDAGHLLSRQEAEGRNTASEILGALSGDDDASYVLGLMRAQRSDAWKFSVERAISTGDISPDQAKELGYWRSDGREWVALDKPLYHVTTAASAVERDGLKSRLELGMERAVGLGGGPETTISFTTDPEIARSIEYAIYEARDVARGDFTAKDIVEQAAEGTGANRPFLDGLLTAYGGEREGGGLPIGLQALVDGYEFKRIALRKTVEDFNANNEGDWTPAPSAEAFPTSDGRRTTYNEFVRPLTDAEKIDRTFDVYKYFASYREHAGGAFNPMFWGGNPEGLAKVADSDIRTLKYQPKPGTHGISVSSLGEIRTVTDDGLDLVEVTRMTDPPPDSGKAPDSGDQQKMVDDILNLIQESMTVERGGPGSGHYGHEGRPGEVGGSKPDNGSGSSADQGGEGSASSAAAKESESEYSAEAGQEKLSSSEYDAYRSASIWARENYEKMEGSYLESEIATPREDKADKPYIYFSKFRPLGDWAKLPEGAIFNDRTIWSDKPLPFDRINKLELAAVSDEARGIVAKEWYERAKGPTKAYVFANSAELRGFVIHPSTDSSKGPWRTTYFDQDGLSGHEYNKSVEQAIASNLTSKGYEPNPYLFEALSKTEKFQEGVAAVMARRASIDMPDQDLYADTTGLGTSVPSPPDINPVRPTQMNPALNISKYMKQEYAPLGSPIVGEVWITPEGDVYVAQGGHRHAAIEAFQASGVWPRGTYEAAQAAASRDAASELIQIGFVRVSATASDFQMEMQSLDALTAPQRRRLAREALLAVDLGKNLALETDSSLENDGYMSRQSTIIAALAWPAEGPVVRGRMRRVSAAAVERGGRGSGHFGHEGRPGKVGGSTPDGGGDDTGGGQSSEASERLRRMLGAPTVPYGEDDDFFNVHKDRLEAGFGVPDEQLATRDVALEMFIDGLPNRKDSSDEILGDSDNRSYAKDEVVSALDFATDEGYDAINNLVAAWAASASDDDLSQILQESAASFFGEKLGYDGVGMSKWQQEDHEMLAAMRVLENHPEAMKASQIHSWLQTLRVLEVSDNPKEQERLEQSRERFKQTFDLEPPRDLTDIRLMSDEYWARAVKPFDDAGIGDYIAHPDSLVSVSTRLEFLKESTPSPDPLHEANMGFVESVYDNTQDLLKRSGVGYVTLYRGINIEHDYDPIVKAVRAAEGESIRINLVNSNALASWSTKEETATRFARGAGNGVVLSMTVPAERVWSTPRTGPGCLDEEEFIIFSRDGDEAIAKAGG